MRLLAALALLLAAAPAGAVERFSMAVYHFNIQYVAGGLKGFPDGNSTDPQFDLDEAQVEDAIIVESLEPLLDIYLRHPTWGADFELQGYMLDVMRARHPAVLAKLKTLVDRSQVAADSFHWSDQLWTAYPRRDQEVSFDLTKASFAAASLPLGKAVWTQEGQFGPGLPRFMKERGLEVAILPRNLLKWLHGDGPRSPLYRLGDVLAVTTTGASDGKVETTWSFVDDGELAVTGDKNPYVGIHFKYKPSKGAEFEARLAEQESGGWKLVTVEAFARRAVELGVEQVPLPRTVDGTWQPKDTRNVGRWMGDAGLWNGIDGEADNLVLTTNARVGRLVRTAESLLAALHAEEEEGLGALDAKLATAWRELLLAQVSDSTGWNPWVGELNYSLAHAALAEAAARSILDDDLLALRILPAHPAPTLAGATAPVEVTAKGRRISTRWQQRTGTGIFELEVTTAATTVDARTLQLSFARTHDRAVFCATLEDGQVTDFPLSDVVADPLVIPAANGLVGLADDLFLIKRTDSVHVAVHLPQAEKHVTLIDMTGPIEPFTWRFLVVRGTKEQAVAAALAENLAPTHVLPARGCGCSSPGGFGVLALFALVARRRRAAP